jgi:hypothetical protein
MKAALQSDLPLIDYTDIYAGCYLAAPSDDDYHIITTVASNFHRICHNKYNYERCLRAVLNKSGTMKIWLYKQRT